MEERKEKGKREWEKKLIGCAFIPLAIFSFYNKTDRNEKKKKKNTEANKITPQT